MDNKNTHPEDTIDFKTLFRLFLKRKWWFIATVILVLAAGIFYVFTKPVIYEARLNFKLNDNYVADEYLQYNDIQEIYSRNQTVFIEMKEIPWILKTDLIFKALDELEEVDDYNDILSANVVNIDLQEDSATFILRVKDEDKKLSEKIGFKLIESLGLQVMENDKKIFDNTLDLITGDIKTLENEIADFENKINLLNEEISDLSKGSGNALALNAIEEKQGEVFIYTEKIIDNEYEIKKLEKLLQEFSSQKDKVVNRVEPVSKNARFTVENDRMINSIIVVLLSLLTGIVVVLFVNYIYKLKNK
ncbi:MAG: hypothetical protein JW997_01080 [Actinobacteria bacterium]|nr:hypothetical protein [Actinomycetota bacterium]